MTVRHRLRRPGDPPPTTAAGHPYANPFAPAAARRRPSRRTLLTDYQPFVTFSNLRADTSSPPARRPTFVMFDYQIYVALAWGIRAPESVSTMRLDTKQAPRNDHFGVMFYTYYARRSGSFRPNRLAASRIPRC